MERNAVSFHWLLNIRSELKKGEFVHALAMVNDKIQQITEEEQSRVDSEPKPFKFLFGGRQ